MFSNYPSLLQNFVSWQWRCCIQTTADLSSYYRYKMSYSALVSFWRSTSNWKREFDVDVIEFWTLQSTIWMTPVKQYKSNKQSGVLPLNTYLLFCLNERIQ